MAILFEVIKMCFFFLSIGMGLFFMRGYYYLPQHSFAALSNIFMPAYLLVTGLMIGYMTLVYYKSQTAQPLASKQYVSSFLGGLVIGITFALFYIFVI